MDKEATPFISEEDTQRIRDLIRRLQRGEHAEVAKETGNPDIERLAFQLLPDDIVELPAYFELPRTFSVEVIAAICALAEAGIRQTAKSQRQIEILKAEQAGYEKRFAELGDEIINRNLREIAGKTADNVLTDISQIIGSIQVIHRSALTETPGIYMEFSLNNLRFSYTDRQTSCMGPATLDVSSVGDYQIIEFTLKVAPGGLTVEQLDQIEKADYNASWAGYGDNLVKYAECPQRLAEIYPQAVLDMLVPELLGTAVSVDFFGGQETADADILSIEARRILRNRAGITGEQLDQPERDAAIIQLAERFPQLRNLFGGPDNPSA